MPILPLTIRAKIKAQAVLCPLVFASENNALPNDWTQFGTFKKVL